MSRCLRDADCSAVKNAGNTFELHVKASTKTGGEVAEKEPDAEFLQSSYFIASDDAKVKELARRAVGAEADPWKKALRIERWVRANMKLTAYEALATADHVARTLEGDCTESSMLAAAMCRAEGVPSRTAIGLIYADIKGAPHFAFHMWTEVWIKGRWLSIDATLGKGYVGATHLKITDHSWHDERNMSWPSLSGLSGASALMCSARSNEWRAGFFPWKRCAIGINPAARRGRFRHFSPEFFLRNPIRSDTL